MLINNTERKKQFSPSRVEFVVDYEHCHQGPDKPSQSHGGAERRALSDISQYRAGQDTGELYTAMGPGGWIFRKQNLCTDKPIKKQVPNIMVRPGVGGGHDIA